MREASREELLERIGEYTKDLQTLQHKAADNEARWAAVVADMEAQLSEAREVIEFNKAEWEKVAIDATGLVAWQKAREWLKKWGKG